MKGNAPINENSKVIRGIDAIVEALKLPLEEAKSMISALKTMGLVVIDKIALQDLLIKVNHETKVDKCCLYLTRKQAILKYNMTEYWFRQSDKDPHSKLKVDPGTSRTSTKRYNEQSILDELERRCI